jgi:hypothetical protein
MSASCTTFSATMRVYRLVPGPASAAVPNTGHVAAASDGSFFVQFEQNRTTDDRKPHQRMVPRPIEINGFVVATGDRRDARRPRLEYRMPDAVGIAPIRHRFRPMRACYCCDRRIASLVFVGGSRLVAAAKSTVSFLRQTVGRSKGRSVSSVIVVVLLGRYARQLIKTTICYVNPSLRVTAVADFLMRHA